MANDVQQLYIDTFICPTLLPNITITFKNSSQTELTDLFIHINSMVLHECVNFDIL